MIVPKSREDILADVTNRLSQLSIQPLTTGVTQAMINGIVDILYSAELNRIATDNETNPTLATGQALTTLAYREFGLTRGVAQTVGDFTFTNFHFYLSGNAKAMDITTDSSGFTIPSNLFIQDQNGNVMMTASPAVFNKNSNSAFCHIISINAIISDIPALALTTHSFEPTLEVENITTASMGEKKLLCSNNRSIVATGTNESDDAIRLRMIQRADSLNQSNEGRLRSILTSIPGVVSVDFRRNKRGNGSVECILNTQLANPSDGVYFQAEGLIKQDIYGADSVFIVKPQYLPLRINLSIVAEGTIANLSEVKATLSIGAADYVNNTLRQGDTFVLANFLSAMKAMVSGISNIEVSCIYVNNRRAVIKDQTAFYNQKFVVLSPLDIAVQ